MFDYIVKYFEGLEYKQQLLKLAKRSEYSNYTLDFHIQEKTRPNDWINYPDYFKKEDDEYQ